MQEFLVPMRLSQNALARAIGVPPRRINEIVLGKRSITADTALRLASYFGVSEEFWMRIQASFDLEEALGKALKDLARIGRESASRLAGTGGREPQIKSVRRRQSRAAMF